MLHPSFKIISEEAESNAYAAASTLGKLPEDVSFARFLADYGSVGGFDHYRHVPHKAASTLSRVNENFGAQGARSFLRAVLGFGIVELFRSGELAKLPQRIQYHQIAQLRRMASAVGEDADWFDIERDVYLKDLGLVTLRLYAAAAQLLDVRCGIPRSIVLKGGWSDFPQKLWKCVRLGGFKPFVQIHTHLSFLESFNEEGWNECYRCCADLYKTRPELLGMFGSSWFYDPSLSEISPRLNYLRDVPLLGGANLFFMEKGGDAIGNAVSTSITRRELYEQGKYMPTSYMLVWGREQQIAWALSNQSDVPEIN